VTGPGFYVKEVDAGIPPWLTRVQIPHRWGGGKFYPVLDTPAALAWLGQVSALEVHVPQWRITAAGPGATAEGGEPLVDRVVFDLDPGEGASLPECVDVACALRERLGPLGARSVRSPAAPRACRSTCRWNEPITSGQASGWAQLAAEQLERALPELVVSTMPKSARRGKVMIDWSQNNGAKTTIAPYSLRGRDRPTVAAPRTWDELTPGRTHPVRHLEMAQVLDRIAGGLDPLATLHHHSSSVDLPVRPIPAPATAPTVVVRAAFPVRAARAASTAPIHLVSLLHRRHCDPSATVGGWSSCRSHRSFLLGFTARGLLGTDELARDQ
jgi:bifunctional non-homologous end joining protein LigD